MVELDKVCGVMNFKQFVNSFQMGSSSWQEDPIFSERIRVAQILINEQRYPSRSLKAPEYLTDFGLRQDRSPEILIHYWKEQFVFTLPTQEEMEKEFETICIKVLPYYIDAYILVLGNYSFVYNQLLKGMKKLLNH